MKSKILFRKLSFLLMFSAILIKPALAATFTASSTGNWTSSATWAGGTPPGLNITGDQIVIPTGITVSLTNSLTINGTLASLAINGTLSAAPNDTISLGLGAITGAGNITAGYVMLNAGSTLAFVGSLNAGALINMATSLQVGAQVSISQALALVGGFSVQTGGMLTMDSGSTIYVSGGVLSLGGGALALTSMYNVTYLTSSVMAGLEMSGTGLNNVTVNVPTGDSVGLSGNVTVKGTLNLATGSLALNGNTLTISGNIASGGSGTISSTSASNITVSTSASPAGALAFSTSLGENNINNFIVNISDGGTLMVDSDFEIDGNLNFMNGKLNIGDYALDMGTSATITGADSSSYVITSAIGYLGFTLNASSTTWTSFPVGTLAHYAPVSLKLNAGSATGSVDVSAVAGVWSQGTTGSDISLNQPVVDVTWIIEPDSTNNTNLNLMAMWSTSMEVNGFDHTSAYITHYTNGQWDHSALASASLQGNGMYSLERDNISSFSPFAVFDHSTPASVAEVSGESQIVIYPNPANDNLNIKNAGESALVNVDITDLNGQIVRSYKLIQSPMNVSLDGLSPGSYFVKMYNDNISEVKKFIKI